MSARNYVWQHVNFVQNTCILLVLIFLVGCSRYGRPVGLSVPETRTQVIPSSVTPIFTATAALSPSMTPIPQPMQIGTLGKGVMSDVFRSQDGQVIAVGVKNILHWYDGKSFKEIAYLPLGIDEIIEIHFSQNRQLVIANGMYKAQVVDLGHQTIVATITTSLDGFISDLSFTPDNNYVAFQVDGYRDGDFTGLWNIHTDKLEHAFDVMQPDQFHTMSGPVVSPDGKLVAAGSDNQVYVWDLASGETKFVLNGHKENVTAVDFSPDEKLLASGSRDHTVRLWDLTTGKSVQLISGMKDEVSSVEFSSEGKQLKIDTWDHRTYRWDSNTQKLSLSDSTSATPDPFAVMMHQQGLSQNWLPDSSGKVVFSPDGHSLALGSEPILFWDLEERTVATSLENVSRTFWSDMQYSPDGQWFAARDDLRNFQVWNVYSGQTKIRRENGYFSNAGTQGGTDSFAISSDSSTLALGNNEVLEIWDIELAALRSKIKLNHGTQRVNHLAFSSDGDLLYVVLDLNDKTIAQTWDLVAQKLIRTFDLPENSPMVFSATGMHWPYFARNNADENQSWIEIWNLDTQHIVSKPQTPGAETEPLRFSPDGKLIMAISHDQLYVWDTATGRLAFKINTTPYNSGIAISPDNKMLAIDRIGQVKLWDISQMVKYVENQ